MIIIYRLFDQLLIEYLVHRFNCSIILYCKLQATTALSIFNRQNLSSRDKFLTEKLHLFCVFVEINVIRSSHKTRAHIYALILNDSIRVTVLIFDWYSFQVDWQILIQDSWKLYFLFLSWLKKLYFCKSNCINYCIVLLIIYKNPLHHLNVGINNYIFWI